MKTYHSMQATTPFSITTPQPIVMQPMKVMHWQVTIQFHSKEDAEDFIEDMDLLKNPRVANSFHQASKESEKNKSRPMNELFEQYGI